MGAAWNVMGASGRAQGELDRVALFNTLLSKPASASTHPAGTDCERNKVT
jgi:hypothetical protein